MVPSRQRVLWAVGTAATAALTGCALGDEAATGRLLWYDGGFYRYALYVHRHSGGGRGREPAQRSVVKT